jgi:hypothetical protein
LSTKRHRASDRAPPKLLGAEAWSEITLHSGMIYLVIERRYPDAFVPSVDFARGYFATFRRDQHWTTGRIGGLKVAVVTMRNQTTDAQKRCGRTQPSIAAMTILDTLAVRR